MSEPPDADPAGVAARISRSGGRLDGPIRSSPVYRLAAVSLALLSAGALGPWQNAIVISASGLDVSPILIIPALAAAGWAVYAYDRGRQAYYKRIAWLLITSAGLVALMEIGNANRLGDGVSMGWGAAVSALAAAGLGVAGMRLLKQGQLVQKAESEP